MTATASEDLPEEWGPMDEIHMEVWKHVEHLTEVADNNALVFFADTIILDDDSKKIDLDPEDGALLSHFLDLALEADTVVKKYLGKTYVQDYLETLTEGEDNE